jgi:hypothetical protein
MSNDGNTTLTIVTAPELQSTFFFVIDGLAGVLVLARRPGVREIKRRQICA